MSQNSNLRECCAMVLQTVFLTDLTVLRLFYKLYEVKCHKTHISAKFVHKNNQVVLLVELTVLRLITTV